MAKKVVKKKTNRKKTVFKDTNKLLIENFVSLQKVMTNLSSRFDELSNQISKLLELFELSANALAKKEIKFETPPIDEKKILQGLENISEQNKIIARGLTLLHEPKGEFVEEPTPQAQPKPPTPQPQQAPQPGQSTIDLQGYQRSISSKPQGNQPPVRRFRPLPKK